MDMKRISNGSLILEESSLHIQPLLAKAIGINEAIILQQLFWLMKLERSGKILWGKKWIYNTYQQWRDTYFIWISEVQLKRIFIKLEKIGLIESCQPEGGISRRKYYRVPDEVITGLRNGMLAESMIRDDEGINVIPCNVSLRSVPDTENLSGESMSKETKESDTSYQSSTLNEDAKSYEVFPSRRGTKEEQFKKLRPVKDFPTVDEFDDFLHENQLDELINGRQELYDDLCNDNWHEWKNGYWRKIVNWKLLVTGLNHHIINQRMKSKE